MRTRFGAKDLSWASSVAANNKRLRMATPAFRMNDPIVLLLVKRVDSQKSRLMLPRSCGPPATTPGITHKACAAGRQPQRVVTVPPTPRAGAIKRHQARNAPRASSDGTLRTQVPGLPVRPPLYAVRE